jgi:hypothetical protein
MGRFKLFGTGVVWVVRVLGLRSEHRTPRLRHDASGENKARELPAALFAGLVEDLDGSRVEF